jgi:hypothetical protein
VLCGFGVPPFLLQLIVNKLASAHVKKTNHDFACFIKRRFKMFE